MVATTTTTMKTATYGLPENLRLLQNLYWESVAQYRNGEFFEQASCSVRVFGVLGFTR